MLKKIIMRLGTRGQCLEQWISFLRLNICYVSLALSMTNGGTGTLSLCELKGCYKKDDFQMYLKDVLYNSNLLRTTFR